MKYIRFFLGLMLCGGTAFAQESLVEFGRFGNLHVYLPKGEPDSIVLFVSGDGGWNEGVVDMARLLPDMGAMIVGIDIRHYLSVIGKSRG